MASARPDVPPRCGELLTSLAARRSILIQVQSTSPVSLRMLGYPNLCGVLYVAWETESGICGEYVLCVLFRSHLVLAIEHPGGDRYDVVAIISLSDTQLQKADDGRGT